MSGAGGDNGGASGALTGKVIHFFHVYEAWAKVPFQAR